MNKILAVSFLIAFLFASNASAGFSSYSDSYGSDSVIAPIQIKNKGIYNLVVSIHFLNVPYDDKRYKSESYEKFLSRFKVEWSGVVIQQILKANELTISDLANLKGNIEAEMARLADQLKKKYSLDKNIEVVFSLSNFFLLEPKDK